MGARMVLSSRSLAIAVLVALVAPGALTCAFSGAFSAASPGVPPLDAAVEGAACPPSLLRPRTRRADDGRFELTAPLCFETGRFGRVVLTAGYRSDGSSSPIRDLEGSRAAGFLHDALYAASGHLRFPDGLPARWTKAEADAVYCAQMARRGVPRWHARSNCAGAKALPQIRFAWQRLAPKRERRWRQWSTRAPDWRWPRR